MSDKLVSVCINAYNAEKFILETVESVIKQTYKNLQIIIVDDCSTDNTYELVKSINDDRIEVYRTPFNGHISFANNESFKYIKGDYIAHIDADDLWVEDKIEKQVAFLESNPGYGACFTHAEIIDADSTVSDKSQDTLRSVYALENLNQSEMFRHFYDNSNRLCHPSYLIRSEIMKQVGCFDVSMLYLHDFDYWMRLLTVTKIYIIPERLTLVRRHGDNNSEMDDKKWNAHNTEFARLIYNSVNICPDELFLEAFSDKLRFAGEHTHEDVELEKGFLLLDGPLIYKGNPVLGLYKFSELFKDEGYIKLAKEKFNFTTRDLYKFQESKCYVDIGEYTHLTGSVNRLQGELDIEKKHMQETVEELKRCKKYINDLEEIRESNIDYINNLENNVSDLKKNIDDIKNSFSWKLTAPLRYVSNKILKHK